MRILTLLSALFLTATLAGQAPDRPSSGELHAAIQKLGVLGSALYVAAHPDDENTRMIAYLANVEKVETGYLSMTRGDGGQNLIAPDISELLGLTRTQELLAARRIDGGKQFFSRANDFGYSKHPDETFNIWDKREVLADAVWVIRQQRPDIMILRFDPRAPGSTHGHHTASAIIGMEAFDLAGDPSAFPEQLEYVEPWQPERLFWNAYSWGRDTLPDYVDTSDLITVDIGTYLPKLGENVAEIAARSRSQHKSQGFGSSGSRERYTERLEQIKGDSNGKQDHPFAGITTDWSRVSGGAPINAALKQIETDFDFDDPAASVPGLLDVRRKISVLEEGFWRKTKLAELDDIIAGALGLYLSATVDTRMAAPGDTLAVKVEITNRSDVRVDLDRIAISGDTEMDVQKQPLNNGEPRFDTLRTVLHDKQLSGPYWLQEEWKLGMYSVADQQLRGRAEGADPVTVDFTIEVDGQSIILNRPVRYHYTDPVAGEQFQPFEVMPPVFVEVGETSYLFTNDEAEPVTVKVTAATDNIAGNLSLATPAGWKAEPASQRIELARRGQESFYTFHLSPPVEQSQGKIVPNLQLTGKPNVTYSRKLVTIDHPHIPTQLADLNGGASVARVDLKTAGRSIGYLPGAGDAIPEALTAIGLDVTILTDAEASIGKLSDYDAIVVGVRAYNTLSRMPVYQPRLLEYVKQGGTLIVQYNTNRGLRVKESELGPFPLELSRDRVTVEEAPVKILAPDHPALNFPNKITAADFEGWVQERGLYFPDKWAPEYTPLLGSSDPGEEEHDGGLLVARYGSGHFVYTGYSFFRELPAGVPGAYRLFANLVALGQTK
ncbi:LmbE family N-acetylglucosaminyl deacetylase [Lewinella aquimaris]|uniref:LmbE family N-acetylglucosaminyl deacetylase n=1 Tax=Neolewinella aquimaris TaxID=1835722 RepID=A0A840E7V5_9BACT|nr:PIG-L family deacetylase [Neolewinella aquimaris]MBB4079812.1 LmbE family N-acetylglucosaminyl deacetylase [Neolewinella aquimaris]